MLHATSFWTTLGWWRLAAGDEMRSPAQKSGCLASLDNRGDSPSCQPQVSTGLQSYRPNRTEGIHER